MSKVRIKKAMLDPEDERLIVDAVKYYDDGIDKLINWKAHYLFQFQNLGKRLTDKTIMRDVSNKLMKAEDNFLRFEAVFTDAVKTLENAAR